MNLYALLRIAGLRYRLLWAKVRSKRGRIVLFLCGYFLVFPIGMVLLAGGVGAGLVAIRSGKAEMVAETVLEAAYLEAILISLVLGFGSSPAFSDAALRRYPLSRLERLCGRQLTAFLEPIWLFVLALDIGVAVGFHAFLGASFLWIAVPAAFLLVVTNFLLARVLAVLVEWIAARRAGALVLAMAGFLVIGALPSVPALVHSAAWWNQGLRPILLAILKFTPPYAAAGIMVGSSVLASFWGLLALLLWCFIFVGLLGLAEELPSASRTVAGAEAGWNRPYDRIARVFGSAGAPLVGKTFRYYIRSPQLWLNYPFAAIFPTILTFQISRHKSDPLAGFLVMLAMISVVGFLSMGAMTMNNFGFDGSGFRRYFLFPVEPADILRAVAIVPLLLGAALIPITLGLWFAFWRGRLDAHMVVMLLSSGFGGLFLFQGLGLWTSLLTPRAMDFKVRFGNKLSFAQNALLISGLVLMFGLLGVLQELGSRAVLAYWYVLPVVMVVAACFYFVTLKAGARVFTVRRERMLSMIERGY